MKRTRVPAGYTIVEVMIVLAVTGALFVAAMALINGQQQRTQFSQSARELETNIQDIMNDIGTGYYPDVKNLTCRRTGDQSSSDGPEVREDSSIVDNVGRNSDCIYVGRAIQFTDSETYKIHTIVGLRQLVLGDLKRDTYKITELQPRSIAPDRQGDRTPDITQQFKLGSGLKIGWVHYDTLATPNNSVSSIIFLGELATPAGDSGLLRSEANKQIDLIPVIGSALGDRNRTPTRKINNVYKNQTTDAEHPVDANPDSGIRVCMDNGSTQHAIITIGGLNQPLGTQLTINPGVCANVN